MLRVKLNLGCGRKILKGYVNLDVVKLPGVDVRWNINKTPYPFKDNTFEEVIADNILEHVDDLILVMQELHRICKPGAIIKIIGPYWHHHSAFSDPTHKRYFTMTTFDYFHHDSNLAHYTKARFKTIKKKAIPTPLFFFIPSSKILNFLGLFIGNIVESLYFELEVTK